MTAGTTYWFGLHLASNFSNNDLIFWETASSAGAYGLTSQQSPGGTFDNWISESVQLAYNLQGTAVPEPSTLAMACLGGAGLIGLGLRRRPRRA